MVVLVGSLGEERWIRQWTGTGTTFAEAVAVDEEDNVYVAGFVYGASDYGFVRKYSPSGDSLWPDVYLDSGAHDHALGIDVKGGLVYVSGWTYGNLFSDLGSEDVNLFLAVYDTDGNLVDADQRGMGTVPYWGLQGFEVKADDAGNVYVLADARRGETADPALVKYTSPATHQWTTQIGDGGQRSHADLSVDVNGYVYIAGSTVWDPVTGTFIEGEAWLGQFDGSGALLWETQHGPADANAVEAGNFGFTWLAGSTNESLFNPPDGGSDLMVIRFR